MAVLTNPIVYSTTSFALFMVAPALISVGTTSGPRLYLWLGLVALAIASLIPPLQRLVSKLVPQHDAATGKESA